MGVAAYAFIIQQRLYIAQETESLRTPRWHIEDGVRLCRRRERHESVDHVGEAELGRAVEKLLLLDLTSIERPEVLSSSRTSPPAAGMIFKAVALGNRSANTKYRSSGERAKKGPVG